MTDPTEYDRAQDERLSNLERAARERGSETVRHADGSETVRTEHDARQDEAIEDHEERLRAEEDANARQESRLEELDSISLTPATAAENPGAQGPGTLQRLRITVPNVPTMLYMGAAASAGQVRAHDWTELNAPGFGVLTEGHVFISAKGDAEHSQMRLQSNGPLSVQTPDKLALGGGSVSVLASEGGTVIAGGAGVMIHGGAAWPWSPIQTSTPDGPDTPEWIKNLEGDANNWGAFMSAVDGFVGAVSTYQGVTSLVNGWGKSDWISRVAGVVANLGGAVGTAISGWGALVAGFNKVFHKNANSFGGTTIYGSTGLILGSGVTAGFYSLAGTCIASGTSVSILAPLSTSVVGKLEAELSGKSTRINGDKEVIIRAGENAILGSDKDLALSAKEQVSVSGGEGALVTGKLAGLHGDEYAVALAKKGVAVHSPKGFVSVHAKMSGTFNVSDGPLGLSAKGPVSISSPDNVHISSGSFVVIVEPSSLYLGKASENPGPPPPKPPPKHEVLLGVGKAPNRKYRSPEYQAWKAKHQEALADWKAKSDAYNKEKKAYDEKVAKIKASDVGIKMKDGGLELIVKGNKFQVDASKTKAGSALVIQK